MQWDTTMQNKEQTIDKDYNTDKSPRYHASERRQFQKILFYSMILFK